jgi:hypothetical protein
MNVTAVAFIVYFMVEELTNRIKIQLSFTLKILLFEGLGRRMISV